MAGERISRLCFEGSKEELTQTNNTQPCVYTVSMAALAAFCEATGTKPVSGVADWLVEATHSGDPKSGNAPNGAAEGLALSCGLEISGVAGFSLGEYAALTVSGALRGVAEALPLVIKRGEFMAEAGSDAKGNQTGGMCAVIGEREKTMELIKNIKTEGVLEAVNFNTKTQVVVAGDFESLEKLKEGARAARLKAIPLDVGAAFHSAMMAPAAGRMAELLKATDIRAPKLKLYSNITGRDVMEGKPDSMDAGEWLKSRMALQVMSPVHWQESIENMGADGIEAFIEFGPGRALSGFVKKLLPNAFVCNIEDVETLNAALDALGSFS
jgi:[acyl-carrier-protein] S-malonyltransferase